jgi:hypothetical protein
MLPETALERPRIDDCGRPAEPDGTALRPPRYLQAVAVLATTARAGYIDGQTVFRTKCFGGLRDKRSQLAATPPPNRSAPARAHYHRASPRDRHSAG